MTTIHVLPNFKERRWEVVINGEIFGWAKHSYDADFHAEMQAKNFPDCEVFHHAVFRPHEMAEMGQAVKK